MRADICRKMRLHKVKRLKETESEFGVCLEVLWNRNGSRVVQEMWVEERGKESKLRVM